MFEVRKKILYLRKSVLLINDVKYHKKLTRNSTKLKCEF